jgi:predicted dehydrogenase
MKKKITVGIIGFGYWGPTLFRNFRNHPRYQVRYVCDRHREKLARLQDHGSDCRVVVEAAKIFDDKNVDLVVIATQATKHVDLICKALEANKHVFVEKPFVLSSADALKVCRLAKSANRAVWIDHTFLYCPAFVKLKQLVANGKIGKPLRYHSTRADFGLFQTDTNVVWHLFYHDAYLMHELFSLSAASMQASASSSIVPDIADSLTVSLHLAMGVHASVLCDMTFPEKKREIVIMGDQGILLWDELSPHKLKFFSDRARFDAPNQIVQYAEKRVPEIIPIGESEALAEELTALASCLDGEAPFNQACESAVEIVRLLEAIDLQVALKYKNI